MARPSRPGARQALLEAARIEFSRAGVHGARVEDMTRRAGLSKGAFYLHFRSKEEAFRELLQRLLGALEEAADRRHEAAGRLDEAERRGGRRTPTAPDRLEAECALDVELLELLWRHRQLVAVVDRSGAERWGPMVAEFRQRLRARTAERLRERQAAGLLRADVDAAVAADVIMGSYEDFGRRMAGLREKPDLVAWGRSFLTLLYQGLLTRRSPRAARRTT